MKFIKTNITGAYVVVPKPIKDVRGKFTRIFCKKDFSEIGHSQEFVQFNHSVNNKRGTIRGLHFQRKPHEEIKLIYCISGSVFDVIVDLRKDSPTFLKWFGISLSKENMKMIYIPAGCAHGFQSLENNSELLYYHTEFYFPSHEDGIDSFDKTVGVKWPLKNFIRSDRDKQLPSVEKYFS